MQHSPIDFLIIGAGPTGLTLACELCRRELRVRLIDKAADKTAQSRALGLQARSLDIFEKLGVLEKMLDRGLAADTAHLYEDGEEVGKVSFTALPIAYPFVLILPQQETEEILASRLNELGGRVERNTSFLELQGSSAILSSPQGNREVVAARWIIGCDGAHSALRHALGLPFKGTRFTENFGLADVVVSNFSFPHRDIYAFMSAQGLLGIIPLPTSRLVRLIMTFPAAQELPQLDISFLENLIHHRSTLSLAIEKIVWASQFSIHRRIVPRMSKENVFLCGDAAHIHSPAGGQGLNIGIQDAFNLAWKLALVHSGDASPHLLKTYHEERHPIARHTLWATTLATFFISTPYAWLRHLLFRTLGRLLRCHFFRRRFSSALAETRTNYRHSRLSFQYFRDLFWSGPQPGDLAPLLGSDPEIRFILLIFGAPHYQPSLSDKLFDIRHFSLDDALAFPYRASRPCLYLIRPDGYIAFRSCCFSKNLEDHLKAALFLS